MFENDYGKIDSSYEMMKEVATSLLLTLEMMLLDSIYDVSAFGFMYDLMDVLKSFSGEGILWSE